MSKKINIDASLLFEQYILKNLSVKEVAALNSVSTATIARLLAQYNIKKSEELRRLAISKTKQTKSEEERQLYSKHVSEARRGKGIGQIPWNKDRHGLQVAWNKGLHTVGYPRTKESIEKARQTCKERYGVDWACQRVEARLVGQNSAANRAFESLLLSNHIDYVREFPILNYSFDFKVNDILIEIDPYATHNSTWGIRSNLPKEKLYHQHKSLAAVQAGFRCIHVWDWDNIDKIVALLKNDSKKVFGRNCEIREVSKTDSIKFINEYHLQNYAKASINVGLFYENNLVSIMTFDKPRYNTNYEYELIRYCSSAKIVGGAEKLFKYFVKKYQPASVISYCDLSKFSGNTYVALGFESIKPPRPSKHWYNPKTKEHFTDALVRQQGFSRLVHKCDAKQDYLTTDDNNVLMIGAGFVEIYDCGQAAYVWQK